MTTLQRILVVFAALTVLGGCHNEPGTVNTPDSIRRAPESATLGGLGFTLDGEAWRNQMPGPTSNDAGLLLTVRLRTVDNSPMPASVEADTAWVVNGGRAWQVKLEELQRDPLGTSFESHAQHGPRWNPETAIDIVVSIHDGLGNRALIGVRERTVQTAS